MKSYWICPAVSILFQIQKVFPNFDYNNVREDNNIRTINNTPNMEYSVIDISDKIITIIYWTSIKNQINNLKKKSHLTLNLYI